MNYVSQKRCMRKIAYGVFIFRRRRFRLLCLKNTTIQYFCLFVLFFFFLLLALFNQANQLLQSKMRLIRRKTAVHLSDRKRHRALTSHEQVKSRKARKIMVNL